MPERKDKLKNRAEVIKSLAKNPSQTEREVEQDVWIGNSTANDHIKEIESLVLRISYPKGNSVRGKLKQSTDLRPQLRRELDAEWEKKRDGIIGGKKKTAVTKKAKSVKSTSQQDLMLFLPLLLPLS